jgi:hypothetical protein
MMQALDWLFWLTGASVWLALVGYLATALLGELGHVRAARRFRRQHLTEEEYALLHGTEEAPLPVPGKMPPHLAGYPLSHAPLAGMANSAGMRVRSRHRCFRNQKEKGRDSRR